MSLQFKCCFFVYSYIYRLFPDYVQYNSRSSGSATGDTLYRIVHRAEIKYRNSQKLPHNIDIREWHKIFVEVGNILQKKEYDLPRKSYFTVKRQH